MSITPGWTVLAERRLGGRQTRHGNPERRARHVVAADLVAERDRSGIAAMLATTP